MKCRFAASLWIWSDSLENEREMFHKVSEIGFEGVEIPSLDGKLDAKRIKDDLSTLSGKTLTPIIIGGGSPNTDFLSELSKRNAEAYVKSLTDACEGVGGSLVCGPLYSAVGARRLLAENERSKVISFLSEEFKVLGRYAQDRSVRIALEPLCRYDTSVINTSVEARDLVDRIDLENVGILLDTFHINIEEKSIETAINTVGDKLFHFHACENDRGAPGSGQVNWQNVRDALMALDYSNWVAIESFVPDRGAFSMAMNVWRHFEQSQNDIAMNGLGFLKRLMAS